MTNTPTPASGGIADDAVPVEVRELLPLKVNPLTPSTIKTASGLSIAISWTQSPAENPYQLAETFAAFLVRAVNDYALRPASPPRAVDAAEEIANCGCDGYYGEGCQHCEPDTHPAPDTDKRAVLPHFSKDTKERVAQEDLIDALYARVRRHAHFDTEAGFLFDNGAMHPADRRAAREASKAEEGRE